MKKYIIIFFLAILCYGCYALAKGSLTVEEYIHEIMYLRSINQEYTAKQVAEQFYQDYPDDGNSYIAMATVNYPDNCQSVINYTTSALSMNIDNETRAVAKLLRGSCYYNLDESQKALDEFDTITSEEYGLLDGDEQYIYHFTKAKILAMVLFSKEYESIVYNATKALEYIITPDMYFVRGLAYTQLGEIQKAKLDFENQRKICTSGWNKQADGCIFMLELK